MGLHLFLRPIFWYACLDSTPPPLAATAYDLRLSPSASLLSNESSFREQVRVLDSLLYASAAGDNDLLPVAPGLKKQVLLDLAEMERDLPDAVAPGKTIYMALKVVDEVMGKDF